MRCPATARHPRLAGRCDRSRVLVRCPPWPLYSGSTLEVQPFVRRRDFGDEVAYQRLLRQGSDLNRTFAQPGRACIVDFAIDLHHAFLAGISIDASVAEGERRFDLAADSTQTIQHRLSRDKFDLKIFDTWRLTCAATGD